MTDAQIKLVNDDAIKSCKGDAIWLAKFSKNLYNFVDGKWTFEGRVLNNETQKLLNFLVSPL